MAKFNTFAAASLAAMLALSTPGFSQTPPDPHHTNQGQPATPEAASVPQGVQDMMMVMMKAMMGGGQASQCGADMQNMGMTEHVEGRVAFLRAELKITDKQAKLWDAFADALRKNAKGMMDANAPMMGGGATPSLANQLDSQERTLAARLDGVKAMKAAIAPLYAALSDEQRKSADELLAPHMGLMAGGMGNMMQGGMMPKQSSSQ